MTEKIGCVQHDCAECVAREQREWVGLTDDEVKDAFVEWGKADDASFTAFVQFIEAKLTEKNT